MEPDLGIAAVEIKFSKGSDGEAGDVLLDCSYGLLYSYYAEFD